MLEGLTKGERYREFLLLQGETSHVVRVPADSFSRWVFTTDIRDRERLTQVFAAHPGVSLLEGIRLLAAEG